jgi:hypothetical protein
VISPEGDALLIVAGAVLQIIGFYLVVRGLNKTGAAIREHLRRARDVEVRPQPAEARLRAFAPTVDVGGDPPTLEARVASLEDGFVRHATEEEEARQALRDDVLRRLVEGLHQAYQDTRERESRANAAIDAITLQAESRQKWAIGCFVVGLVLMAIGSAEPLIWP